MAIDNNQILNQINYSQKFSLTLEIYSKLRVNSSIGAKGQVFQRVVTLSLEVLIDRYSSRVQKGNSK